MHHKSANKKLKNVPTSGSNYARRMGIHSPPSGHPQNKRWATSARGRATSAQILKLILGNTDIC